MNLPVILEGEVEHGDKRGRELGFPTANIGVDENAPIPPDGVYAGTYVRPSGEEHACAISIGRRPTFYQEHGLRLVEAYLIDWSGDLYGETARVRIERFLRGQVRFDSVDDLVEQMHNDVAEARGAAVKPGPPPVRPAARTLLATDLDGTLLRSDMTVSDRTRAAIAGAIAAGIGLIYVTGRPPRWMPPVAEQTGHKGIAVCANGAVLYDLDEERVIRKVTIAEAVARGVIGDLREHFPGIVFAIEYGDRTEREGEYRLIRPRPDVAVRTIDEMLSQPAVKILARYKDVDPDVLLERAHALVGDRVAVTSSTMSGLLEMASAGVDKAVAVAEVASERGYSAQDAIGCGDMPNDLPLLGWAGHAVAVANAHPSVLAAADEVTASNDEDGVALILERLLGGLGR